MQPGRKPAYSQAEFVRVAVELADTDGISAVTVRSLGTRMNASSTAIYRYFADKDLLLAAMRDELLRQVMDSADITGGPREQIIAITKAYRKVANAHPCLSQLMVLTQLSGPEADRVPVMICNLLEELGITESLLVRGYRQLESLVVGTTLFDFSGAPLHLSDRRLRLTNIGSVSMTKHLQSDIDVESVNESAFDSSLHAIMDSLIAESRLGAQQAT